MQQQPSLANADMDATPTGGVTNGLSITVHNAAKRFNREWIFRNLSYQFIQGNTYAITGPNGSGKSTLLQTIAGAIAPSEGKLVFSTSSNTAETVVDEEKVHACISIAAPYLEVIEEMTAAEFLQFHAQFKSFLPNLSIATILELIGLTAAKSKQIRFYSSGMKQRIKLAQAIFTDAPVLLLDEPCTNLDASGYQLYHQLINDYCSRKLVIVCSNDINEYDFCKERLSILDYK